MSKSEFGQFLISRRARLRPSDVGLPDSGRRRTPGLRREEVAALAGVSVDYLARLEQGRDTNPSISILAALSQALQLDETERTHFGWLALTADNSGCAPAPPAREQLSPTLQALLESVTAPAFVLGRELKILSWNARWEEFATPLGVLEPESHQNFGWYVFANPSAPKMLRNWDEVADSYSARLRAAAVRWPNDDSSAHTIGGLHKFPEFARRWEEHRVENRGPGILRIAHPRKGNVEFEYETLEMDDISLVVWLTDRSIAQTPGLRLVEHKAVND